jgi:hypothetical protein
MRLGLASKLVSAFMLLLTGFPVLAQSVNQNVTVSVGVGDTVLVITGATSPSAFVTFKDGGSIIGTTTADGAGNFTQSFNAMVPGIHSISIYALDTENRLTDTVTTSVNLIDHSTTTLDVFLPPSISLSDTELIQGSSLVLRGQTYPASTVTITLDDNLTFTVAAGLDGVWQYVLDTSGLSIGSHSLFAAATKAGGINSYPTAKRQFTISAQPIGITPGQPPPPAPTIIDPVDGAVITTPTVMVRGTATPNLQIVLYDGDRVIGSAFADADGNWRIEITLTKETYTLRARACRLGVCGDFSNTVRITVRLGVAPPGIDFWLDRYVFNTAVGQPILVASHVRGGQPPYTLDIEWGDGDSDELKRSSEDNNFTHTYRRPGRYNGKATLRDATGKQVGVSFSVGVEGSAATNFWLVVLIALLAAFGIWLLQREQRKRSRRRDK